ncbi:MAG: ATP-binding protein, partial [Candidatus Thorarchaeota archaeon]
EPPAICSLQTVSSMEMLLEMFLITKDGRTIPFEYTGKIFRSFDGNLLIVAIGRDVTERKKAEQKLKESEKRYREAYNRANFYKDLIAHDMNNILQSIRSSVELYKLSEKRPEMFKDKKDFLSSIIENVFRGSKLASNVIKLSKLEETKMPLELVNINKNLMDAIVFIHEIYQNRNLHINVEAIEEDHFAIANELILDLFENILMNSVRHNINPVVEIQTRISEMQLENKKYCKIEFMDNGVGIHDDRKVAIFQRRTNDENSTRGMGIGLSLVKQLINSYNGKIWIENRIKDDYTKGSNFIVLIPV